MKTVDVIIPTYKPTKKLMKIISYLEKQSYPVRNIILINTEEKYFTAFFYGTRFLEQYSNVIVRHISKYEFDHGATRRFGVSLSDADYFICMTDDAVPMDDNLVEKLLQPLLDGKAQLAYARQCVGRKCSDIERFSRKFNYPEESYIKSKDDIEKRGIKTYFCSNVCAAYNRAVYDKLGGFVKHTIFNEDMLYAAKLIESGGKIAYVAEAKVKHYHRYTNFQQLQRNFDLGVSQAKHPEVFQKVPSVNEGMRLVKETEQYLRSKGKNSKIPGLYITSAYKYLGYRLGKAYKWLPKSIILKLTMNRTYWMKVEEDEIKVDPHFGYGRSNIENSWNKREKKFVTEEGKKEIKENNNTIS